jgi:hypothetical protein
LFSVAPAISLTACAQNPESVSANQVSDISYRPLSCADLAIEAARLNAALTQASKQQQAQAGDGVGVVLIRLPISSMTGGNVAREIARLKGELGALDRIAARKRCVPVT